MPRAWLVCCAWYTLREESGFSGTGWGRGPLQGLQERAQWGLGCSRERRLPEAARGGGPNTLKLSASGPHTTTTRSRLCPAVKRLFPFLK